MSWDSEQITLGQKILAVVKSLGLSKEDTAKANVIAIEAALAESDLHNVNYGDHPASMGGQMSSSRGLFQQISAWGSLADRMDPVASTRMFLTGGQAGQRGLLDVPGWNTMNSWNAAQAVQGSEFGSGSNYLARHDSALDFLRNYGNGQLPAVGATPVGNKAKPGTATGAPATGGTTATPAGYGVQSVGLFDGVQGAVITFALKAVFTLSGLGLVVLGVWRMSAPVRNSLPSPI